jgi:hypothetical protein
MENVRQRLAPFAIFGNDRWQRVFPVQILAVYLQDFECRNGTAKTAIQVDAIVDYSK